MTSVFGHIYLLKMGPYYKIGKTVDLEKRPFEIVGRYNRIEPRLPYDVEFALSFDCFAEDMDAVERRIHEKFSDSRMRGEWFMLSSEDCMWFLEQNEIPFWPRQCSCAAGCDFCRKVQYEMLEQVPCPS